MTFLIGLVVAGRLMPTPTTAFEQYSVAAFQETPTYLGLTSDLMSPVPSGPSFADIVERLNPAVVSIEARSRGEARVESQSPESPGPFFRQPERDQNEPRRGAGTGFIIDAAGFILTNNHVVEGADRIMVRLADGRRFRADRIGSDPDIDIALIRVEAPDALPFAILGDSDGLRVGEWVIAIGDPLAYEHTVTAGVVSFIGRKLFNTSLDSYIQTDAAISFGNSGGPLINTRGEVIGINSAISSKGSNIGFAVPINQASAILPQLRETGRVSRGYIGVILRDVDADLQRALGLSSDQGALVQDIAQGSPGERAGLRTYDVIVAVDGRPIEGHQTLIKMIAARSAGSMTTVHVLRDGRALDVTLKLAERPQRQRQESDDVDLRQPTESRGPLFGLSVSQLDGRSTERFGLPPGTRGVVVSRVEPLSAAFDADVQRGHILLEIDRQPVLNLEDYSRLTAGTRRGDVVAMYFYRPEIDQRSLETLTFEER